MIKLTNTTTGKRHDFTPIKKDKVTMYVCGVTPYSDSHIGHGRVYVTFDLLYRLLKFLGYNVTYCRNYTDIDDKILKKAQQEYGDKKFYKKITDKFIQSYQDDMRALNTLVPDVEPYVTQHIPEIINFIQGLIDAGKAYIANGDVYFHIPSFKEYGKLSKHDIQDLRAGERVEVSTLKKDPLDFALWKSEQPGTFWKSPWGWGRPGWHIECSALAKKYLGESIDIHAGGLDLVFPHHENEIAQSEALHKKPFANFWVHNALVTIDKKKMSKSLGNVFILREVFKDFDPMVIRFYYLKHHYKGPLDFTVEDLKATEKTYKKLVRIFNAHPCPEVSRQELLDSPLIQKLLVPLTDDLNTSGMFGILFEHLDEIKNDVSKLCKVKTFLQQVLGLTLAEIPEKKVEITPEIAQLLKEREKARTEKNWQKSDEIRDKLAKMGIDVHDKKL